MTVRILTATESTTAAPVDAQRLGGLPAIPDDFTWPTCRVHHEPMQFTAQIHDRDELILVFVCQADPGLCDSWDPDYGSNAAIVVPRGDLHLAAAPESPSGTAVAPGGPWQLGTIEMPGDEFFPGSLDARKAGLKVAGQYGGQPYWIQDDTGIPGYRFVAMLTEEPADFNFGGGYAYLLADDHGGAKLIWQC